MNRAFRITQNSKERQLRIPNLMRIAMVVAFLLATATRLPLAVRGFATTHKSKNTVPNSISRVQWSTSATIRYAQPPSDTDGNDQTENDNTASTTLVGDVVDSVLAAASERVSQNGGPNQVPAAFQTLFRSTLQRAYSTTAMRTNLETPTAEETTSIPTNRFSNTTATKKQRQQTYSHHSKSEKESKRYEFPFATDYKSHPALNNVALAQALWASVVRPNVDSIIDATCGNGNDSIVLAEILFGNNHGECTNDSTAELVCLDVQTTACERTTQALREVLPPSIRVMGVDETNDESADHSGIARVMQMSHELLPRPTNTSSVGLIVYNLGWLPGNSNDTDDGKACITTLDTTLASLVDAVSLLRIGGMLSVVTYPGTSATSADEDAAVELFVTCLALRSSRTRTWQEAVDACRDPIITMEVRAAMEAVVAQGPKTTWRVSKHDKLGMERPPVLFTATRIK